MYQAVEAIYRNGHFEPLESFDWTENEHVLILRLPALSITPQPPHVGGARGSMKGLLSSVDEFIARKEQEKRLEEQ